MTVLVAGNSCDIMRFALCFDAKLDPFPKAKRILINYCTLTNEILKSTCFVLSDHTSQAYPAKKKFKTVFK